MGRRGPIQALDEWCKGRSWIPRAALLAWFGYIGLRHLLNPMYASIFKGLNLGIHEGGHLLFAIFGNQFLTVAGGTLLQLAVPLIGVVIFVRQRDYFAICFAAVWLATNLYDIAIYLADARALALPLVTVGHSSGPVIHDWNYMLFHMGLINQDTMIASGLRAGGFLALWSAVAAGTWMCCRMIHHARTGGSAPAANEGPAPPSYQFPGSPAPKPPVICGRLPGNQPPFS